MERTRDNYHAYTLRLSRVNETGEWRATLYCAHTGERWQFATLERLCAFLLQTAGPPPCPVELETEPGK